MPVILQLLNSKTKTSTRVTFYSKDMLISICCTDASTWLTLGKSLSFSAPTFFLFFFHFYVTQLDLSYLLISKCIIIGLMFMSSQIVTRTAALLELRYISSTRHRVWHMVDAQEIFPNGEMNCANLFHLSIPRSYCHKNQMSLFITVPCFSRGPCPEDKDLLA